MDFGNMKWTTEELAIGMKTMTTMMMNNFANINA